MTAERFLQNVEEELGNLLLGLGHSERLAESERRRPLSEMGLSEKAAMVKKRVEPFDAAAHALEQIRALTGLYSQGRSYKYVLQMAGWTYCLASWQAEESRRLVGWCGGVLRPSTAVQTPEGHAEYSWEPFLVRGQHQTFTDIHRGRLTACSHDGPAVYKWEGKITEGPKTGLLGIYVGETGDMIQRIRQYRRGTQERGNRRWREEFLERGEVRLYVAHLPGVDLSSVEVRRGLEQQILGHQPDGAGVWVVNRRRPS